MGGESIFESQRSVRVIAVDGSPAGGGRTRAAVDAVSAAAAGDDEDVTVETVWIGGENGVDEALGAIDGADAAILGSPVHRASFATPLKRLLDSVPRSWGDEPESPLRGKPVAVVCTGASLHHFLALDSVRNVLAGFFAAHVLPPGLYVPADGFDDETMLVEPYAEQARLQGSALVELARALRGSPALRSLRPQV